MMNSVDRILSHQRLFVLLVIAPPLLTFGFCSQILMVDVVWSCGASYLGFLIGYMLGVNIEHLSYMKTLHGKIVYFFLGVSAPITIMLKTVFNMEPYIIFIVIVGAIILLLNHYLLIEQSLAEQEN